MRYRFIARHLRVWPTRWMCRALGVGPSGFYHWMRRPECERSIANRRLLLEIRAVYSASHGTYGSPRVWRELRAQGETCSEKRVSRLMRAAGIKGQPGRRRRPPHAGTGSAIAPNVLERRFEVAGPNRVWASDITYLPTAEGWLFLAVVLDLYSRAVVGWAMGAYMTRELVADALTMAVWRRRPVGKLLHHSDQGSQYASDDFQGLLASLGITCSMSRRGNCWDNACVESFFSTLKRERVYRRRYQTRDEAKADVFDYIERFYNPKRRHSTLGHVSPMDYEKQTASQT